MDYLVFGEKEITVINKIQQICLLLPNELTNYEIIDFNCVSGFFF